MSFHDVAYRLHTSMWLGRIFKFRPYLLCSELSDCESVLDLGCGNNSIVQYCKSIKHSVGVEVFAPYLEQSKKAGIHSEYVQKNLNEVDFPDGSFDAVFLGEVIEHMRADDARKLLEKAERWARKKVILSTPNGFRAQDAVDGNTFQQHLSGWTPEQLSEMGYRVKGLWGWNALMKDYTHEGIFDLVKFKPRYFWFGVMVLTAPVIYHIPSSAFILFAVKDVTRAG